MFSFLAQGCSAFQESLRKLALTDSYVRQLVRAVELQKQNNWPDCQSLNLLQLWAETNSRKEVASLIVSPLLQVMYDKLASYLNGVETPKVQKKNIQKLQDKLLTIQAVIEGAEEKQLRDKTVRIWLSKLADAAYDADDLLDEISTRALRRQTLRKRVPSGSSSWKWKDPVKDQLRRIRSSVGKETRRQVRITSFTLQSILTEFEMRRKLTDIIERLEDIAREMSTFSFKEVVVYKRSDTREKRETGPSVDASQILGRTEDRKKIVDLLLSHGADTWVIPIVGIAGIGKTTLAQVVYNDPNLDGHFDKKIWVSLYDNFSTKKLLTEILECLAERRCESSHMGVLQSQLRERDYLYGKRYLLVMDDVWSDDQEEWDKVRNLLRCGAEGSKIIVTTRSEKVASLMGNSTTSHVLKALTKDDCWTLFKQQAFAYGEEAKVLGLLRFRRMEDEWLRVQESALWNLDVGQNRILSVLRLSFNHLPSHLKRCFAYCALFPRKYHLNKEKLIQQWIAGGLVQTAGDDPTMLELLANSDTAVVSDDHAKTRYALVDSNYRSSLLPKALYKAHKLRSLNLLASGDVSMEALRSLIRCFRHLKILNLSGSGLKKMHRSIGNLIYLRYLDLSNALLETLPETIGHLCNLRTLDLSGCTDLLELPGEIVNLVNLIHLNIKDCPRLASLPFFLSEDFVWQDRKRIQTLPRVIASKYNLWLLHRFDLRGELKITPLENAIPYFEDRPLLHSQLHTLELFWGGGDEGLQPSPSIRRLSINGYPGRQLPPWMNPDAISNLTVLKLINCRNVETLSKLASFQSSSVSTSKEWAMW
ncbi:hypothetical protein V6N13_011949 [Hibiscus sabdariffa]